MDRTNLNRSNQQRLLMLVSVCALFGAIDARCADISTAKDAGPPSPEMVRILNKANKGSIKDELKIAADYYLGHGVPQDFTQSANWYRRAAEQGDPEGQIRLGQFYLYGTGVQRDAAAAAKWFALAAASGSLQAKLDLGLLYLNGAGVRRDLTTGRQLIQQAAESGDARSMAYLGDIYYFGMGITMDREKGEEWLMRAAKLNDAKAQFSLGALYSKVPDHPHDFAKAAGLLRLAAAQGFMEAKHDLAILLIRHPDLSTASDDPVKLLEVSAASGAWRSSMVLGMLERDGNLLPKDERAAYRWFQVACLQGGPEAERLMTADLNRLKGKLNQQDLRAEDDASSAWVRAHKDGDPLKFTQRSGEMPLPLEEVDGAMRAKAPVQGSEVMN